MGPLPQNMPHQSHSQQRSQLTKSQRQNLTIIHLNQAMGPSKLQKSRLLIRLHQNLAMLHPNPNQAILLLLWKEATLHQSQATMHPSQATMHLSQAIMHQSQATMHLSQATTYPSPSQATLQTHQSSLTKGTTKNQYIFQHLQHQGLFP